MSDKVGAIIIGSQKCGTTTLFGLLAQCPEINTSTVKELDFWSRQAAAASRLDEYHSLFENGEGLRLEASPSYTQFPHFNRSIWEDLYSYNPALKLIYLVRPPLERMRSAYRHYFERGYVRMTFGEFLRDHAISTNTSRYTMQVEPYIQRFGREKVALYTLDDLKKENQSDTLQDVGSFLGINIPPEIASSDKKFNDGKRRKYDHRLDAPFWKGVKKNFSPAYRIVAEVISNPQITEKPRAEAEMEQAFLRMMEPDIAGMERLLGKSLETWRKA